MKKERLSVYISSKNRAKGVYRNVIINNKKSYYIDTVFNEYFFLYKVGNSRPSATATSYTKIVYQLRKILKNRYPNKIITIYYQ